MNATRISTNESGLAGLEPELKKGTTYYNAGKSSDLPKPEESFNLPVSFKKVVFYDDLNVTLNDY